MTSQEFHCENSDTHSLQNFDYGGKLVRKLTCVCVRICDPRSLVELMGAEKMAALHLRTIVYCIVNEGFSYRGYSSPVSIGPTAQCGTWCWTKSGLESALSGRWDGKGGGGRRVTTSKKE